jgi:hypothetical protein
MMANAIPTNANRTSASRHGSIPGERSGAASTAKRRQNVGDSWIIRGCKVGQSQSDRTTGPQPVDQLLRFVQRVQSVFRQEPFVVLGLPQSLGPLAVHRQQLNQSVLSFILQRLHFDPPTSHCERVAKIARVEELFDPLASRPPMQALCVCSLPIGPELEWFAMGARNP